MELSKLMVDFKTAWIDFPGCEGLSFELANLSRTELQALRKKCVETKFDRKTRQPYEDLNEEKFIKEFSKATIRNWKGFKLKYLEGLMVVDISAQDPETELDFSASNAELLISNSTEFDTWVNEVIFDLSNFRSEPKGNSMAKTGEVA